MTTEHQPRDEAFVPDWPKDPANPGLRELDPQQHKAACAAHRLFLAMANQPLPPAVDGDPELDSFLPRLDARRWNHTVLIDGARGSGKTGVMLRVLQDWSQALRHKPIERFPADIKLEGQSEIVPVGLLDLETVPKAANLATRIAGLFERVISAIERRGDRKNHGSTAPSWALMESDELGSREKWRHFIKAAALEWDRSLERRRANIDPEAYAVEVEQAERQGLNAGHCFRDFIDALVKDWKAWRPHDKHPLFVVPVDDADLAPGRVVELFELMRRLWHPRVGYLLTGYSDLFEHVLTTHFRWQIDRGQAAAETSPAMAHDPTRRAEGLARDIYQKAVPPAQRLTLYELSKVQRLSLVDNVLGRVSMDKASTEQLAEYLKVDDLAQLALPNRWRQIIDLRKGLEWGEFDKPLGAEHFALALWRHALRESSLSGNDVRSLENLAYIDEHRGILRLRPSNTLRMTSAAMISRKLKSELGSNVNLHYRFMFVGTLQDGQRQVSLDTPVVAAWLLMTNVMRRNDTGFEPPREDPFTFMLADAHFSWQYVPALPARSTGTRPANIAFKRHWPAPAWKQYFERQWLYNLWEDVQVPTQTIGDIARAFLWCVLKVSRQEVDDERSWDSLAKDVVRASRAQVNEIATWARCHAGLLAAPEWGLPHEDANQWLTALRVAAEEQWPNFQQALREVREQTMHTAISANGNLGTSVEQDKAREAVLAEINLRAPKHDWNRLIEDT